MNSKITLSCAALLGLKTEEIEIYMLREALQGCLRDLLDLVDMFVNSQVICSSPSAQMLLTLPVPGTTIPSKFTTAPQFAEEMRVCFQIYRPFLIIDHPDKRTSYKLILQIFFETCQQLQVRQE